MPSFMKLWATWVWTVRRDMYSRLEPLVDDGGLIEQAASAVEPAEPSHGPARVLGGQGELERPGPAGVGLHRIG
jgi:hypothetical protein